MYNAEHHTKLLAGMVDKGVEFFVHQNEVKCIHDGRVFTFEEFPEWIISLIQEDMLKYPDAIQALANWENLHNSEYTRQYIYCRFGGIDFEPDINAKSGEFADIQTTIQMSELFFFAMVTQVCQ